MPGTGPELASWFDLATFANMTAQPGQILVIDVPDVIDAKRADLAAWGETSATAAATSWPTWSRSPVSAFAGGLRTAEASATAAECRTISAAAIGRSFATTIISIESWAVSALSFFTHWNAYSLYWSRFVRCYMMKCVVELWRQGSGIHRGASRVRHCGP
jgi:hypothetical protein